MFIEQKRLPSASDILNKCPIDENLGKVKQQFDKIIKDNFVNRKKLTVVCGPCSADNLDSMDEYLRKLKQIQTIHPNLLIVARIYTTKPHSNGQGYKGTCFQQSISDDVDIEEGIIRSRQMMINCLKLGLPVADELLYPELYRYFEDLVSYWFVGARSSEDAIHRGFASGLDICCGVKNGTDGDLQKVVDSVYAISNPCVIPYNGAQIATKGCKYAHVVLRGGKTENGFVSNLSYKHTNIVKEYLRNLGLNDFIMVDLSHANSGKVAKNQIENAKLVANNPDVHGVMGERYLFEGASDNSYGVSKTDPCLNFDDTVKVVEILDTPR
ncbi:MAG: 3-deoxy-7-phosphoheptulonate synthase [Clostridia bacterium]|nr:3-deoxy-7-phosphoheptulonate synthase [Clostridia bacterium]